MSKPLLTVSQFEGARTHCHACGNTKFAFQYVRQEGYPSCVKHHSWPCDCGEGFETRGERRYVRVTCMKCSFKMPDCRMVTE